MSSELDAHNSEMETSFSALAERFVELLRTGKPITIEEFANCHPEFKSQIHFEFPALEMAEKLRPSEDGDFDAPATVGNFRVTAEIGRGAMGRVYSGFHQTIGRPVAIKILHLANRTGDPTAIERFDREARAAGSLSHPNIVQIFDHGAQDDLFYIAMQRVYGLDLASVAIGVHDEKHKFSESAFAMDWRLVASIGLQVSSALSHAHEKGLIHRDIKPANLMIEANGHTWVTDFGLVKAASVDDLTLSKTGAPIGTPRYMAPEQMRGICDSRSDIYGLGITLYELAAGERAWDSLSGRELIDRRSTLELQPVQLINPAVPTALSMIIMKCCEFRPEDRYQTAAELHLDLEQFLHAKDLTKVFTLRSNENRFSRVGLLTLLLTTTAAIAIGFFSARLFQKEDKEWFFREPLVAIKLLKDDTRRRNFIATWPDLWFKAINDPETQPIVSDLAKGAFRATLSVSNLSAENKSTLVDRLTATWGGYFNGQTKMLSNDDFRRLHDHISNFTRLARLAKQLANSSLTVEEKYVAQQLILMLQLGFDEKRFRAESAEQIIQLLTEVAGPEQPTDEDFRRFITMAKKEILAIGGDLTHFDYLTPPLVDGLSQVLKSQAN